MAAVITATRHDWNTKIGTELEGLQLLELDPSFTEEITQPDITDNHGEQHEPQPVRRPPDRRQQRVDALGEPRRR